MGSENCSCKCKDKNEKEDIGEINDLTVDKEKVLMEDPIHSPVVMHVNEKELAYPYRNQITFQDNAFVNDLPLKSKAKIHQITERIQTEKIIRVLRAFVKLKKEACGKDKEKSFAMTGAVMGINIENGEKSTTLYDRTNRFGVRKWGNGSWYSGQFSDGNCNGYGKYTNQYGDVLCGIFAHNKVNYYCAYHHFKGGFYDGEWMNNMIHGLGREEWKDNSSYEGIYVKGAKEGIGTYVWSNKSMYQGQWVNNSPNGRGIFTYNDGRRYEGEWSQGKKNGIGLFTWPDGKKYVGTYENDKLSGFGMSIWTKPKTKIFLGFWVRSKQNGFAKIVTEQQEKYSMWKEGKKIMDYSSPQVFFNDLEKNHPKLVRFYKMNYLALLRLSLL